MMASPRTGQRACSLGSTLAKLDEIERPQSRAQIVPSPATCLCFVVVVLLSVALASSNVQQQQQQVVKVQVLHSSETSPTSSNKSTPSTSTSISQAVEPLSVASIRSSDTPVSRDSHASRGIQRDPRRVAKTPTASMLSSFKTNDDYDDEAAWSAISTSSSGGGGVSVTTATSYETVGGGVVGGDSESSLDSSEDDDAIIRDEMEFRRRLIDQSWPTTSSGSNHHANNQTSHRSQNTNTHQASTSLVAAFFSHIDKQWKFAEIVLIIAISAILNLVTIVGNIMVLISFKMDRSLQTVSNYFLLSLALADLLIGLISMPLYTLYLLLNYWPLGALMCDIWLAIDYLNSNAAVLNMLIISFDRYFSVTRPLTYRAKRTTKHAILMISFAWILSLTIWTPAIFTYPYYKGRTVQGTDKCEIEFVKANTYLTFVTAILAFYIPVAIMIYLYWRIWLETKKRYRDLTTLFLVSGVGAAAPSRPTRPPPSSLTSGAIVATTATANSATGLNAAPGKGLARSLGARLVGGASHEQQKCTASPSVPATIAASRKSPRRNSKSPSTSNPDDCRPASGKLMQQQQQRQQQRQVTVIPSESNGRRQATTPTSKPEAGWELHDKQSLDHGRNQHDQQVKCAMLPSKSKPTDNLAPSNSAPLTSDCKLCKQELACGGGGGATSKRSKSCRTNCCYCCSAMGSSQTSTTKTTGQQKSRSKNCCYCPSAACSSCCNLSKVKTSAPEQAAQSTTGQSSNAQEVDESTTVGTNNSKCHKSGSKTSLYQMIADAAGSSHQRSKIHPKNSSVQRRESGCDQKTLDNDGEDDRDNEDRQSETISPADDERKDDKCGANEDRDTPPKRECLLVDVATSPINFASAGLEQEKAIGKSVDRLDMQTSLRGVVPVSPMSPEPEDFETRIVSHWDKFTFETNDPKLVGSVGPTPCSLAGQSNSQPSSRQRCCKFSSSSSHTHHHHHANRQQVVAGTTPNQGHHHHHHHHHHHNPNHHHGHAGKTASSGGHSVRQSNCCCADMISVHDAECRLCRPLGRPEQHNLVHHVHQHSSNTQPHHHGHHSHHHHHHHHHGHQKHQHNHIGHGKTDCKKCSQQRLASKKQTTTNGNSQNELYKQNIRQEQVSGLANSHNLIKSPSNRATQDQSGSLPILNALQQPQQQQQQHQSSGDQLLGQKSQTKNGKKFSQKLTFSDILMERSNSCVTIESEHQTVGSGKAKASGNNSGLVGGKSTNKRLRTSSKDDTQDIVKRNADRLRTAFDDDLDDDEDQQPGRGCLRQQPAAQTETRRSWLKCFVFDMFRGRNRPVRYKTDYRCYAPDDAIQHETPTRRSRWINSICCSQSGPANEILPKCSPLPRTSDGPNSYRGDQQINSTATNSLSTEHHHHHQKGGGVSSQHSSTSSTKAQQQCHHYHPIQPKSERKAAKTLSTLLLVFIVTWLPYNVLVLIKTLSGGEDQVPEKIWNFSYYLCYINSTINPLCYALCNAQFRRTYMRILKCKLSNEHNSTRRLVPIQSSSTWNKDLRLNSTSAADCSTNSTMSHQHQQQNQQYNNLQPHLQQMARTAEGQRHRVGSTGQERHKTKIPSSSDSSADQHRLG